VIPTLFPCYASADRAAAKTVAEFVERGADVRIFLEEGEMRPNESLAQKAREARMADLVVALFSRHSLPPRWPRAEWEDALVNEPAAEGARIAFARLDDCIPPRVLHPMFELGGLAVKGLRDLKRWVRNPAASPSRAVPADLEVLGIALADRPGFETVESAATAGEFAAVFHEDFDAVLRLDCGPRSLAAMAGDLAAQLGLRLEGELHDNLDRLREFCAARRFLVVLADAVVAPPELLFDGRCSTLVATEPAGQVMEPGSLAAVQDAFARRDASWTDLCALARRGRRLARDQGRLAECCELMQEWHAAAETLGDRAVMEESAREMIWILEGWGRTEEAARLDYRRAVE
jgi:TIR domain